MLPMHSEECRSDEEEDVADEEDGDVDDAGNGRCRRCRERRAVASQKPNSPSPVQDRKDNGSEDLLSPPPVHAGRRDDAALNNTALENSSTRTDVFRDAREKTGRVFLLKDHRRNPLSD